LLKKTTLQSKEKGFDAQAMKLAALKAVAVSAGIVWCVSMAIPKLELKTKRLHESFLQVRTYSCLLSDEEVPHR